MNSIHRQLTLTVCVIATLLLPAGALVVYLTASEVLVSQFDGLIAAKAQALVAAAEAEDGEFEIDLDVQAFAGFGNTTGSDYFEVTQADGRVLARSSSLKRSRLAAVGNGALDLPNGRKGRAVVVRFTPEDDNQKAFRNLRLAVASESTTLDRTLRTLALVLVATGVVGVLIALGLLRFALKRGLRPLNDLALKMQQIRLDQSDYQLDNANLPEELQPVGQKLNDLLNRVSESLARERRFSSHAAHELRTPLAELKGMTELIATWPDEATPERCHEMLAAVSELESLLEKLSLLSRAEAQGQQVHLEPLDLEAGINASVERFQAEAAARGLTLKVQTEPDTFRTDPVLWQSILNNLIGNAISHAPVGDTVIVEASPRRLAVSNAAPDLNEDDVACLFERFWRKNTARPAAGGRDHSGLGLSIVAACSALLGGRCEAVLSPEKQLRVQVVWGVR